jgi:hypothetical protein
MLWKYPKATVVDPARKTAKLNAILPPMIGTRIELTGAMTT